MKKRILHVIPSLVRGGAQRLVVSICNELEKNKNFDVQLIIFRNINEFKEDTKNINIEYVKVEYKTKVFNTLISNDLKALRTAIDKFSPDILHTHLFEADLVCRINIFKNLRYFSHFHDHDYNLNQYLLKPFKKSSLVKIHDILFLEKCFSKSKNTFISISSEIDNYYLKKTKRLKLKMYKVYNCVDYEKFKNNNERKSNKKIQLINCARNILIKNQEFLIDLMKVIVLDKKFTNIQLTILGDGVLYGYLKKKIKKLNLENYILLPGMVKDVENHYKSSDIYVHSALDGIFGISTLEAVASGLPIVGLRGNSEDEVIKNKVNALIIENNNIEQFIGSILELINNRNLYNEISKNNFAIGENFSSYNYVKKLINIYLS